MTENNNANPFTQKTRKEWIEITSKLRRPKKPEVPKACWGCPWLFKAGNETYYCFSGNSYPNCIRRNAS